MGKQYTFWRQPNGKPYRKEDGKFVPAELLKKHGQTVSVDKNGGFSWPFSSWILETELSLENSFVVIDEAGVEINQTDSAAILSKAISKQIKKQGSGQSILSSDLMKIANTEAANFLRTNAKKYAMVASFSIEDLPAKTISIFGHKVSKLASRNRKYQIPTHMIERMPSSHKLHLASTNYSIIKVEINGRSIHEAMEKSNSLLNVLRSLWTLHAIYQRWSWSLGSRKKPVGVIHSGPVQTLHYPDGTLATDGYWGEPNYSEDKKLFTPKNGWVMQEKFRKSSQRAIQSHPFGNDIQQILIRYISALDEEDLNVCFLKIWSLLEFITGTVGLNYDRTIQRTLFGFKDRHIAKELLESMRLSRNRLVHAAIPTTKGEQTVYLIKSFIEPHLLRLINNQFQVNSLREYGEFLDLPDKVPQLKRRVEHYSKAIKLLGN